MKKILLVVVVQGLVIFVITGLLCLFMRGDFFFRALAPIFWFGGGRVSLRDGHGDKSVCAQSL